MTKADYMASGLLVTLDTALCAKGVAFGFERTLGLTTPMAFCLGRLDCYIICGRAMTNYIQAELTSALCWPR